MNSKKSPNELRKQHKVCHKSLKTILKKYGGIENVLSHCKVKRKINSKINSDAKRKIVSFYNDKNISRTNPSKNKIVTVTNPVTHQKTIEPQRILQQSLTKTFRMFNYYF